MAKPLRGRRSQFSEDEDAGGGGDERQVLTNSGARADTIRMAVREQARMDAEIKTLNTERREFLITHVKGDLGFKISDWNAIYRVSQLEAEDRDELLDTFREGFAALGIGGQLDWIAAAAGEPQPEPAPRRRGRPPRNPPVDDPQAYAAGKEDGLAGHRDHAARWPNGELGAAAYELGHTEGERERHDRGATFSAPDGTESATPADAPVKRGRGRPRKNQQPELNIVGSADAAAQ